MAKQKGGIKTVETNEVITPETANAKVVQVVPQAVGEENVGTTQRLFGDLNDETNPSLYEPEIIPQSNLQPASAGKETPQEIRKEQKEEATQVQESSPSPTAPTNAESANADESFDIEKVLNKKIKAKIDGKEEEVTLKELRDNYQINKHLAQAADKVGEERRRLAEERRQFQELRQQRANQYQEPLPNQQSANVPANSIPQIPPELNPLMAKIQSLENQLSQYAETTRPVIFESNRQRVSNELKSQGFDDFLSYIPKMELALSSIPDPALVQFYDTPVGAKALYFQLKAQDLNQRPNSPAIPASSAQNAPRQENAAIAPQTRVDSGSQPSSAANDDSAFQKKRAFKRASELGTDSPAGREAWNQVLSNAGLIPGE